MSARNGPEQFWQRVSVGPADVCWLWKGRLNHNGYGEFDFINRSPLAHRFLYELLHGPVPNGQEVMHTCHNRACCNPSHLKAGTHAENMKDKQGKLRPHEILWIRASPLNQYVLARMFSINQSTVSRIKNHRRLYKNV